LHRLAVFAWGGRAAVENLLLRGFEVSHLCGDERCFNPLHLVVDAHSANERRKHDAHGTTCGSVGCNPRCV
jgi:hypothetical protein